MSQCGERQIVVAIAVSAQRAESWQKVASTISIHFGFAGLGFSLWFGLCSSLKRRKRDIVVAVASVSCERHSAAKFQCMTYDIGAGFGGFGLVGALRDREANGTSSSLLELQQRLVEIVAEIRFNLLCQRWLGLHLRSIF